jgi:hypothetical protein
VIDEEVTQSINMGYTKKIASLKILSFFNFYSSLFFVDVPAVLGLFIDGKVFLKLKKIASVGSV